MGGDILWLIGSIVTVSIASGGYAYWRTTGCLEGDVVAGAREPRRPGERRIVCAGDSLTRGSMSFDYIQALRGRLGPDVRVFNAGVNGDLAFNLAERLPSIVACAPDDVVVLIGTNDICGAQLPAVARRQKRAKRLPELPTQAFFEQSLARFLRGVRSQTHARIILVTPPLLGEDLRHPVHARLRAYAQRMTDIAHEHGARVIRFHAAMANALRASRHTPRPGFSAGPIELAWMAMVPLQRHLAGMNYDRIALGHGLWGSADLIHLTETSGSLLVALLEEQLREPSRS